MSLLTRLFRKKITIEVPEIETWIERIGKEILGWASSACNHNVSYNIIDGKMDDRIKRPISSGRYDASSNQYTIDILNYINDKGSKSGTCKEVFTFYVRPFVGSELYWVDLNKKTEGSFSLKELETFKQKVFSLVMNWHYDS